MGKLAPQIPSTDIDNLNYTLASIRLEFIQ